MKGTSSSSNNTSNDLLFRLQAQHSSDGLNYRVISQNEGEVKNLQNAPAISMSCFILESDQTKLLTTLSVYSEGGSSRDQVRLLYMNRVAFSLWEAMGKCPTVIGSQHRPPSTAVLAFGVPFSE